MFNKFGYFSNFKRRVVESVSSIPNLPFPDVSGVVAWYDASYRNSVLGSDKITPCSNGGAVGQWNNRINSTYVTPAYSTLQTATTYDHTNNMVKCSTTNSLRLPFSTPLTLRSYAVVMSGGYGWIFGMGTENGAYPFCRGGIGYGANGGIDPILHSSYADANVVNGTMYQDGIETDTIVRTLGSQLSIVSGKTLANVTVGGLSHGDQVNTAGAWYHEIIASTSAWTTEEFALIHDYLKTKWSVGAITVTNPYIDLSGVVAWFDASDRDTVLGTDNSTPCANGAKVGRILNKVPSGAYAQSSGSGTHTYNHATNTVTCDNNVNTTLLFSSIITNIRSYAMTWHNGRGWVFGSTTGTAWGRGNPSWGASANDALFYYPANFSAKCTYKNGTITPLDTGSVGSTPCVVSGLTKSGEQIFGISQGKSDWGSTCGGQQFGEIIASTTVWSQRELVGVTNYLKSKFNIS